MLVEPAACRSVAQHSADAHDLFLGVMRLSEIIREACVTPEKSATLDGVAMQVRASTPARPRRDRQDYAGCRVTLRLAGKARICSTARKQLDKLNNADMEQACCAMISRGVTIAGAESPCLCANSALRRPELDLRR